jgi:uncharacterized membrane protein YccC
VVTAASATPGVIASFWADLAPAPGRWQRSVFMGLGTMTAFVLSWSLQVPSFSAPVIAYMALQPANVCTWRNLLPRLLLTGAGALVSIPVAGVLVQLPWLLLPAFFVGVALVAYWSPVTHGPLELLAVLYPFSTACYMGVFDPAGMPTRVGDICFGYAVGITTATAFSRLLSADDAAATLGTALAGGFARARARLHEVTARYCAAAFEPVPGESPLSSQFARDMQLLERVRQEGRHPEDVAVLALGIVILDRALTLTDTMDALGRQAVHRTYRQLLAPQLTALIADLDAGLRACEMETRERGQLPASAAAPAGPPWPDFRDAVAAIRARQLALRRAGVLANVDIIEEANTDAFVQALVNLSESLHMSPEDLRRRAEADAQSAPGPVPRFDPYAARYALRVGLGATISYLIGIVADTPELFNILWHPVFVAVASYGATIRRAGTRVVGTVIGCALAILATVAVIPNVSELPALALLVLAITVPSAYIAIGGPRFSYVGVQILVAFAIVGLSEQPITDIREALWRVYGTLLGIAGLFVAFYLVGPDYAGRQLVARFAEVIRGILRFLPAPGATPLRANEVAAVRQQFVASFPEILRLTDEARPEGVSSGADPEAAIAAAGRAVRIGHRLAAVSSGRAATPRPALSESLQTVLGTVETVIRESLGLALSMLEARHTMARPGSRGYREACAAAAAVAARPRPDPSGALTALLRAVNASRSTELADWPPAAHGAFVAEIEHLRRVIELLPSLDEFLGQMVLPRDRSQARDEPANLVAR